MGLVCGAVWSIMRRKERWSFRRIGAFAAAGMALGSPSPYLIPDEFISTAVRATRRPGHSVQATVAQVLSDDSLAAIIRQERPILQRN